MRMQRHFIPILKSKDIIKLRRSCELAAKTLTMIGEHVKVGVTTDEINTLVHDYTVAAGARPSPLGYRGFPKSVCTSINNVVCHGIPDGTVLKDGDIINVDVTSYLGAPRGFHGDTSATFYVGEASQSTKHVVEVARQSLAVGIAVVKPGAYVGDIGAAVQQYVEDKGCSVVREYCGHGIGREFHCEPTIPHYGRKGTGPKLRQGMVFTIEPMVNLGAKEVAHLDDGWTVLTKDGSLSAQFEHTLIVVKGGVEVLTRREGTLVNSEDKPWVE